MWLLFIYLHKSKKSSFIICRPVHASVSYPHFYLYMINVSKNYTWIKACLILNICTALVYWITHYNTRKEITLGLNKLLVQITYLVHRFSMSCSQLRVVFFRPFQKRTIILIVQTFPSNRLRIFSNSLQSNRVLAVI